MNLKCNININPLKPSPIPNKWNGWYNYKLLTDNHYEDGWRDYVVPHTDVNEKLGDIYYDDELDIVTHEVLEKSDQEITEDLIRYANHIRSSSLLKLLEEDITERIQNLDGEDALEHQDVYPIWEPGLYIERTHKYQAPSPDLTEMWLWEAIVDHTSAEHFKPMDTPTIYKRVAFDDEILAWKQPLGAHDAYMIGDKVYYPDIGDDIWESTVDGNTYAPGVVEGQWIKL